MPDSSWRPEADEAVLHGIADALNKAFGRSVFARAQDAELIVQFEGKTAWISADGTLTGVSSTPQNDS